MYSRIAHAFLPVLYELEYATAVDHFSILWQYLHGLPDYLVFFQALAFHAVF
jgi:hypothetical protein